MSEDTVREISINPFASRYDRGVPIRPLKHQWDFVHVKDEDLEDFGRLPKNSRLRLDTVVAGEACDYVRHSQPQGSACMDCDPSYHWHLGICLRTAIPTGFEPSSGFCVSTTRPEEAAEQLCAVDLDQS